MKNIYLKISVLICLCMTLFLSSANATNYYVSALTGDDNNSGLSESQAFATIQSAADLTNSGDNVFIMNGTYSEVNQNSKWHQCVLTITRSGDANDGYITYKNYPGHSPKLSAVDCVWGCVEIYASYIKFDGLELVGTNASITYTYAKSVFDEYCAGGRDWNKIGKVNINGLVVNGVDHVYLSNCIVRDFSGGGIAVERVDYAYIEYNTVYNNAWYMMYAGSGISLFHSRDIDTNTTAYKNIIRGNITYGNKCLIPWASGSQPYSLSDGNGIIIDNNTNSQIGATPYHGRTLVENNVSYNNGGGGVHGYTCANVDIINNTAYNNGTNVGYPEIDGNQCTNTKIYNNIMYARTGGDCNGNNANVTYNYNIYYNGTYYRAGANDLENQDPKFASKGLDGNADFSLQSTSPGINSGSTISGQYSAIDILGTTRPQGSASDRGAYEVATVSNRTPENPSNTVNGLEYKYYEGTWSALPNFGNLSP
ncbi:MAG: right-handed parallel beta-helix repeat-containing protein, partial [Salinivirgaceae bacterium]|nr:right-handed parallel beta-helix repeat-containing protein [Salinivirgaceae bacterium]